MSSLHSNSNEPTAAVGRREIKWDALAAIIASLVGFLALLVAGYTAYIQRYTANIQLEQVRAQVWPYLEVSYDDGPHTISMVNPGVGPSNIREVQIRVNGKPQRNWDAVLGALGISASSKISSGTFSGTILSPGEHQVVLQLTPDAFQRLHIAMQTPHLEMRVCFCSTLNDCWLFDRAYGKTPLQLSRPVQPVEECPRWPPSDIFLQ